MRREYTIIYKNDSDFADQCETVDAIKICIDLKVLQDNFVEVYCIYNPIPHEPPWVVQARKENKSPAIIIGSGQTSLEAMEDAYNNIVLDEV